MNILVLTPIYKRPEVVQLFLHAFENYKTPGINLRLLPILSPQDPYFETFMEMFKDYDYFVYDNLPIGKKKMAGLTYSFKYDWDYMMELGSDNIVNPKYFELIKEYFGLDMFGLLCHLIWDGKEAYFMPETWNDGMCFGAGRCISRNILEQADDLWGDFNEGLDTMSRKKIYQMGFYEVTIDVPYMMLGIKTNTNITPMLFMKKWGKRVSVQTVKDHFNMTDIPNLEILTPKGFDKCFYKKMQEFPDLPQHKIYDLVEFDRMQILKDRLYADWDSYKVCRNRRLKQ